MPETSTWLDLLAWLEEHGFDKKTLKVDLQVVEDWLQHPISSLNRL